MRRNLPIRAWGRLLLLSGSALVLALGGSPAWAQKPHQGKPGPGADHAQKIRREAVERSARQPARKPAAGPKRPHPDRAASQIDRKLDLLLRQVQQLRMELNRRSPRTASLGRSSTARPSAGRLGRSGSAGHFGPPWQGRGFQGGKASMGPPPMARRAMMMRQFQGPGGPFAGRGPQMPGAKSMRGQGPPWRRPGPPGLGGSKRPGPPHQMFGGPGPKGPGRGEAGRGHGGPPSRGPNADGPRRPGPPFGAFGRFGPDGPRGARRPEARDDDDDGPPGRGPNADGPRRPGPPFGAFGRFGPDGPRGARRPEARDDDDDGPPGRGPNADGPRRPGPPFGAFGRFGPGGQRGAGRPEARDKSDDDGPSRRGPNTDGPRRPGPPFGAFGGFGPPHGPRGLEAGRQGPPRKGGDKDAGGDDVKDRD